VTWLVAALLGVVQGLTEFLPISSSAHLILGRALFGWDADALGLAFDVACHVGTLLAVVAYFWDDLRAMAAAGLRPRGEDRPATLLRLVVVGTVPAVVVGLLFGDFIESRLRTPGVTVITLFVGALGLLLVERLRNRGRDESTLSMADAVALGVAQASALVPGVSRSGATITIGMLLGLRRESAARFSFLLGVPAIAAAAAREGLSLVQIGLDGPTATLFGVGLATSAVVGYLTIKYFLRYLGRHRLDVFAWYRIALAIVVLVWVAR